jgi:S-adenosyl methyltransferase
VNTKAPDDGLSRPHAARMYDYFLGGKTNYTADRRAAERAAAEWPSMPVTARANRAYMHRAAHELAHHGFRQFLDIGTGIPTRPNLHDVVQSVAPEARVLYTDNDPIVLTHARALMQGTPEGRTDYIEADVTDPDNILKAPALAAALDLARPVAVSLHAVCHFLPDALDPHGIVARIMDALPSGSALSLSHGTADLAPARMAKLEATYNRSGVTVQSRSRDEVARFFDGLDLWEPGIVLAHRWRPDVQVPRHTGWPHSMPDQEDFADVDVSIYAGIGIKR